MATAVEDSARPPPKTTAAGPPAPVKAMATYATAARVVTTCKASYVIKSEGSWLMHRPYETFTHLVTMEEEFNVCIVDNHPKK